MGMAASQARFLGITARKTNTEYEGQQVNQQRTALANQSANLFNQLLGLNVPTPPSKSDSKYTKTVYAFIDDTGATATINSIVANPDSKTMLDWPKVVKYSTTTKVDKAYRNSLAVGAPLYAKANTTPGKTNFFYNYIKVGTNDAAKISRIQLSTDEDRTTKAKIYQAEYNAAKTAHPDLTENDWKATALNATKNLYKYDINGGAEGTTPEYRYFNLPDTFPADSVKQYDKEGDSKGTIKVTKDATTGAIQINVGTADEPKIVTANGIATSSGKIDGGGGEDPTEIPATDLQNIAKLKETYNSLLGETTFYKYTINGVDYYIPQSNTNDQANNKWNTDQFRLNVDDKVNPPYGYYNQTVEEPKEKEAPAKVSYDASGRLQSIVLKDGDNALTFNVSVNSVTDEDKYENDFNQYKFEMAKYEKTVEDINAQTEAIQAQDRTLELRLKQLDTEQEALTQEMDAIKKVIDKNVETTFKTFA